MTAPDGKPGRKPTDSKGGPRRLRHALSSITACLVSVVSIGGRIPLPDEAEKLARKWIYAEDTDDEC